MNIQSIVVGFFDAILNILNYLFIFGIFGLMYFIYWRYKNYNYKVILRERLNDGDILIHELKGRLKQDKKETSFVLSGKVLSGKYKELVAPIPPDECVQMTSKGRYFVEGYLIDKTTIVWAKDRKKDIELLEPVTQSQRNMLIHQLVKAEKERGFQFTKYLPAIIGLGFILGLFVITVTFWEDITKPSVQAIQLSNQVLDRVNDLLITYQNIRTNQTVTITPTTTLKPYGGG